MIAADTRAAFSERLRGLLASSGISDSPTKLARAFNTRTTEPVTVHAARKWIVGEAIPNQAKLVLLADMLGADAQWLRFGGPQPGASAPAVSSEELELVGMFRSFSQGKRTATLSMARALKRLEGA